MFKGSHQHMCPGNFGLVFLLIEGMVYILIDIRDGAGMFRKALDLNVTSASFILHDHRAKHDEHGGARNPVLTMGQMRDLSDQNRIGEHAKTPGLFVSTRR